MNELEQIIQRMIDAGESEATIKSVIEEYERQQQAKIEPQEPGATVEEVEAPDMELPSEDISLDGASKEDKKKAIAATIKAAAPLSPAGEILSSTLVGRSLGAFLARTSAGIVDAGERILGPLAQVATPQTALPTIAAMLSSDEEGKKKIITEMGEGADMTPYYELADLIDEVKPKYFDEEGQQQGITDLISQKKYKEATNLAVSEAISSAPSTILTFAFPGIGSAALATSVVGQEFEQALEERPDATIGQLYSASTLKGLAEFGTEYAGGKLFRYMAGMRAANVPIENLKDLATSYFVGMGKAALGDAAAEGVTEAATSALSDLTDLVIYGDEVTVKQAGKNAVDSFIVGALLGGPSAAAVKGVNMAKVKQNREKVFMHAAPVDQQKKILAANSAYARMKEQYEKTPDPLKETFKPLVEEAKAETEKLKQNLYDKFNSLTNKEIRRYADNIKKAGQQNLIAVTSRDQKVKEKATIEAKNAYKENQNIIGDLSFYDSAVEEKVGRQIASADFIAEKFNRLKGINREDLDAKFVSQEEADALSPDGEKLGNAGGFFISKEVADKKGIKQNKDTIYINLDVASATEQTNVIGHELLHYLISKKFKTDNASMQEAVGAFKEYVKEVAPEAYASIEQRIEQSYKNKKGKLKEGAAEEYLNVFSDLISKNKIDLQEGKIDKVKNTFTRLLQGFGFKKVKLETGKDVFDFVKNYTLNVNSKNKYLARAAAKDLKIKDQGLFKQVVEEGETEIKKSLSEAENENLAKKFKESQSLFFADPKTFEVISKVAKSITKKYYDPIAPDAKRAVTRDDYEISAQTDLFIIAQEWNPDKQDFGKFLANRGFLRLSNLAQRLGIESTEEYGGVGIMADVDTSKEAAAEIEEIAAPVEEEKAAPQKELLSDAIDLNTEVGGITMANHIQTTLNKALTLATKRYNEEISANRTVTPFVAEIKSDLAQDLKKTFKAFMNQYGYEEFLKDNKRALLQNYTTTYLAKHPLFKKGVQKSLKGTMGTDNQGNKIFKPNWVSPVLLENKYEFVDEKGNKAARGTFDRDNAGARGLTSGPEFIRRNPKINSVITDNEFIDYHFKDGALRRKKKQNPEDALAMQLASEIGFEQLAEDFRNKGELFDKFQEVGELYGQVITESEIEKATKDLDRGTIKLSAIAIEHASEITDKQLFPEIYKKWKGKELKEYFADRFNLNDERAEEYADIFSDIIMSPGVVDKTIVAPVTEEEFVNLMAKKFADSHSRNDSLFLVAKEIPYSKYQDEDTQKYTKLAFQFREAFVTEIGNGIKSLSKEEKIDFIRNLLIYDHKLFTKGETDNKVLRTNKEFWEEIISPIVKANNLTDTFSFDGTADIIGPLENGKVKKINHPSNFDLSSTANQLMFVSDKPKTNRSYNDFNAYSKRARKHLLDTWEIIKKSNNAFLASHYLNIAGNAENSALRQAAPLKYFHKNLPAIHAARKSNAKKDKTVIWEHMTPALQVQHTLMSNFISEKLVTNKQVNEVLDKYYVAFIPKQLDLKLSDLKLGSSMGKAYTKLGMSPEETRYASLMEELNGDDYSEINLNDGSIKRSVTPEDVGIVRRMIERKTGLDSKAEISEAKANMVGRTKGKFKFFVPPGADDFVGLLYYMAGKGTRGDQDLEFFNKKLLEPFAVAHSAYETYKQQALERYNTFKRLIQKTPSKLKAKNKTGYTNEHAVRVYLWYNKGVDIPGVTKAEVEEMVDIVKEDQNLLDFAKSIRNLTLAGEEGYPDPEKNWFTSSMTIDILDSINNTGRKEFFKDYIENAEAIFGKFTSGGKLSGDMANRLEAAYGRNYVEALSDVLWRMKNGRGREFGSNRLTNIFTNWVNDSVGAIMFFNTKSALLQTISTINFINLTDNNPLAVAKTVANRKQFFTDLAYLMNSDFLRQRRAGLKIDVNTDDIAAAAEDKRNPVRAFISAILKKGFLPTQMADSLAISLGGASFYRNRINTYIKDGLTKEEAENRAYLDFKETAETSQQSSRPDKISMQQASPLGRIILAFANTPQQYARIIKKAVIDLKNGRGDYKTNLAKIVYYGAIQNIIFSFMQSALFTMFFTGDEEEEEDRKKMINAANGILDTFLRGAGFYGAIASTAKNVIFEAYDQYKSKRPDYREAALEAISLSPPIDRKLSNLLSASRTFTYKKQREKIFTEGVSLENPIFEASGKIVSATTNIPLDRVVSKMENISNATRDDISTWQSIALTLGWPDWVLGIDDKENEKIEQPRTQGLKKPKRKLKRTKYFK